MNYVRELNKRCDTKAVILGAMIIVLGLVDTALTHLALQLGGTELNPVAHGMLALGLAPALVIRLLLYSALITVLIWFNRGKVFPVIIIVLTCVCVWNACMVTLL